MDYVLTPGDVELASVLPLFSRFGVKRLPLLGYPHSWSATALLRDCSETTPYHLPTNSVPPPIAWIGGGPGLVYGWLLVVMGGWGTGY